MKSRLIAALEYRYRAVEFAEKSKELEEIFDDERHGESIQ